MKVRYSELTANPAYYSFGYAVYGTPEPGESVESCYAAGFLPFVGARDQDPSLMYMVRGTRVRVQDFAPKHYHQRVLRKVGEGVRNGIAVSVLQKGELNQDAVTRFFLEYFSYRFGKGAMGEERFRAILASPYLTHIAEYRLEGEVVAYSLEARHGGMAHVWYQAYVKRFAGSHFGIFLYLDLLKRLKEAGATHLYFGVTYGPWMRYKTNFQPLEYWDGERWVIDRNSDALKRLLAGDPFRLLAFNDRWRDECGPYYPAPYPFTSARAELRFLHTLVEGFPRVTKAVLLLLVIALLYVAYRSFFG